MNSFKCGYCLTNPPIFQSKIARGKHIRDAHPDKCEKCKICGELFNGQGSLYRHKRIAHTSTQQITFKCQYCPEKITNTIKLLHYKKNHPEKYYKCEECRLVFKNKMSLENHRITCKNKQMIKCFHCASSFPNSQIRGQHIREKHPEKCLKCKLCDKTFVASFSLNRHSIMAHDIPQIENNRNNNNTKPLTVQNFEFSSESSEEDVNELPNDCDICYKDLPSKSLLKTHILTKHPTSSILECKSCDRIFTSEINLKKHNITHRLENNDDNLSTKIPFLKCQKCNVTFTSKILFEEHQKQKHGEQDDFKCLHCPKYFPDIKSHANHIRENHREKCIKCQQCDKICINVKTYNGHSLKVHRSLNLTDTNNVDIEFEPSSDEGDVLGPNFSSESSENESTFHPLAIQCSFCPEKFKSHQSKGEHVRQYHPEKCFKCNTCERIFSSEKSMLTHKSRCRRKEARENDKRNIETINGKFVTCPHCQQNFPNVKLRGDHIRAVHPNSCIKCQYCDKIFVNKISLIKHRRKKHKEIDNFKPPVFSSESSDEDEITDSKTKKPESSNDLVITDNTHETFVAFINSLNI